jgi:hypothetical protein
MEFNAAQRTIAKHRRERPARMDGGHKFVEAAGGRVSKGHLFTHLVYDMTQTGKHATKKYRRMRYHGESEDQGPNGKVRFNRGYLVTDRNQGLRPNRFPAVIFEDAFLDFLENVDLAEIVDDGKSTEVKQIVEELNKWLAKREPVQEWVNTVRTTKERKKELGLSPKALAKLLETKPRPKLTYRTWIRIYKCWKATSEKRRPKCKPYVSERNC